MALMTDGGKGCLVITEDNEISSTKIRYLRTTERYEQTKILSSSLRLDIIAFNRVLLLNQYWPRKSSGISVQNLVSKSVVNESVEFLFHLTYF